MSKETGGTFKKDGEVWEIVRYDNLKDSYVCKKLNSIDGNTRKFKEEEMEGKK